MPRDVADGAVARLALALAGLLVACGGGGSSSGIATINGKEQASKANSKKSASKQDTEEGFRKYAECMRKHGIDMPDPNFSGNGGVTIGPGPDANGGEGGTPTGPSPAFEAADKACRHFIDDVVNASGDKPDPAEQEKMKEAALAFAQVHAGTRHRHARPHLRGRRPGVAAARRQPERGEVPGRAEGLPEADAHRPQG